MESNRYLGDLGAPIYCTSSYASDLYSIRAALLTMDRNKMSKEQIQKFYKAQIKRIDEATEHYESSLWIS